MSDRYPIYRVPLTPKQLFLSTTKEDTLYYKIQELLPELKAQPEWADKPDEEIENYIVRLFNKRNQTYIRAHNENRAHDMNDPRDANWKQYSYEEIIEMYKKGIDVPDDCLKWAYSQAAGDTDIAPQLEDAKTSSAENIDEAIEYDNTSGTYKQDKEAIQQYVAKAEEQEQFIKTSEEQLAENSKNIETKKRMLETERQEAQIKMDGYKSEYNAIGQKIQNGEEVSDTELSKYNHLDTMLNNENKELILSAGNLEDEIASLESEINTTNKSIEYNQVLESKINDTAKKHINSEKYNSKYICGAGLSNVSRDFSSLMYSTYSGDLSTYSTNLSGELHLSLVQSEYTAVDATNVDVESTELIGSIQGAEVADLVPVAKVNEDQQEPVNENEEEISENQDNENAVAQEDNEAKANEVKPQNEKPQEVKSDEQSADAEEIKPETAETQEETESEKAEETEEPVLNANSKVEAKDNRIASTISTNAADENENNIDVETDNTSDVSGNKQEIASAKSSDEVDKDASANREEPVVARDIKEQESIEADQAISAKYAKGTQDNKSEEPVSVPIAQVDEDGIPETEPKTPEQLTKASEVQRKDMAKVFEETDSNPEARGITTNRDATLRDASFSNVETSITSSADELEVLRQKALKYNTAGIEAKNTTTSIGETDFVINADGGAAISGQGGSLTRNNNVNETEQDLNKLAETRDDAQSVNNDINDKLIALGSLSDRNMSSVTTTANMPVQSKSSDNSNELNKITRNVNNSSDSEAKAYRQAENAEEVGKGVINNSTSELEKNETKNEIGHSNELFVSEDIDDESYDEMYEETVEELDSKQTARYSDMAAPGIMDEEVSSNNMATDGLTAEIAEQDMSNAISENIQSISEEILKVEATQTLANNNAQDTLNTRSVEAAKSSILTYGEKVQQKDNNTEIKRKVLTSFEIKRRDEMKKAVEKVSSSAKMKH